MTTVRRRSHARERGAIGVEAALVVIVVASILGGAVVLFSAYRTKLATMQKARERAWTAALAGCAGGGDTSLAPVDGALATPRAIARGTTLTKPLATTLPLTTATDARREESYGLDRSIQSSATIFCNEIASDISAGDVENTIDGLYDELL
jgi:Flp pilus assembly protein TadG